MCINLCGTVLGLNHTSQPKKGIVDKTTLDKFKIILEAGNETAKALIDCKYKQFDALVKNFGCQMTAVEVFQLIFEKKEELKREAESFLRENHEADVLVSEAFAKLVTFRLLSVINDNKPGIEGEEIPFTNITKLGEIKKKRAVKMSDNALEKMIAKIQKEESQKATVFVQTISSSLEVRKELIKRMLTQIKKVKGISTIPLLYNTEAILRTFRGVIVLKNKLELFGKSIEGRKAVQIFLKMPEEKIIEREEVTSQTPLLVIEGTIPNEALLREKINQLSFIAISNANAATLPQYIGNDPSISDAEALQDIENFKTLERKEKILQIFNIDHYYVSTLAEEMGGSL